MNKLMMIFAVGAAILSMTGCKSIEVERHAAKLATVQNADGTYEKLVAYGTSTKDALTDWDDVVISKDGYSFAGWEYDTSTVMSTVTAYPSFDKVEMSVVYIFGGVIAVFAVAAIFFATRH